MSSEKMLEMVDSSYLSAGNMSYLDALYEEFLLNPQNVSPEWQQIFTEVLGERDASNEVSHQALREYFLNLPQRKINYLQTDTSKAANVADLIAAYRKNGHHAAHLDPLEMIERTHVPSLDLSYHHLKNEDLGDSYLPPEAFSDKLMALSDIIDGLKKTYCSTMGIEFMHIANSDEVIWLQRQLEQPQGKPSLDKNKKIELLNDLIAADGLERYLHTRYVGQKRFSLEGGDALIPMMKELIHEGAHHGLKEIVIGMAHRGRLNVLINVLGKEPDQLFNEFEGKVSTERTGDVKYHLGFSSDLVTKTGKIVHIALAFNPSHLEIIGPVIQGSVRSRLRKRHDLDHKNTVLPIVIHGDAAFAGQGVVMETFNFSQARGYCTGGTVHIVINNQIGFTTSNPLDARSTLYCTDVAKMVQAPVLHVNGDDPEAVLFVTKIALDFRMKFKRDIVIDLVCYRRHGHNEADEPSVTQPKMYEKIKRMPPLREIYAKKLIQDGLIAAPEVEKLIEHYRDLLDQGKSPIETTSEDYEDKIIPDWSPYFDTQWTDETHTAVDQKIILDLAKKLDQLPQGFEPHPVVKRLLLDRQKMASGELPINWGFAEIMAYASLLNEGYEVRLSGQDSGRGTFSHRHAVLHDANTGDIDVPLERVVSNPDKPFSIIDSVLSEEAVLAFEYGYSASEPSALVLWEAQFGDFSNGAQVVIDQFISSAEQKWGRLCGLVMLLPHGYEGQGPEHSSARLERFMQLCAQENMQVLVPTTPAQIFHLLRRQLLRQVRKPLIVMTPKSLLRHKLAVSNMEDLSHSEFKLVIPEIDSLSHKKINRVLLCCGKVYYDLLELRRARQLESVALIRIEQLYPFPKDSLELVLSNYHHVDDFIWCQEEPQNQGAWLSIKDNIEACLNSKQKLSYIGRNFAAAPAGGSAYIHAEQQKALIEKSLNSFN